MRKYLLILLCALCVVPMSLSAKANKQVVVLSCDLHCQGCCDKVMKNIAFEKGVKDIVCDLSNKTVTVTYDANKTNEEALLAAFAKIGKPAVVLQPLAPDPDPSERPQSGSSKPKERSSQASSADAETGASTPL